VTCYGRSRNEQDDGVDEVLFAERNHLVLNEAQWIAFQARLEAPPRSHPRMKRMLREPTILDQD